MKINTYKNYIHDLGITIKEKALEAKLAKNNANIGKNADYESGYLMAYYEVVSLMQQQADAFNIDLNELGLENLDPELNLL